MTRRRILVGVIVLLGLIWVCTGGLVVDNYCKYEGPGNIQIGKDQTVVIQVNTRVQRCGVPLVFSVFIDRPPYSIALLLNDMGNVCETLAIDEASLHSQDGNVTYLVSRSDKWTKSFQTTEITNSYSDGIVKKKFQQCSHEWPGVIEAPIRITFKLTGRCLLRDGTTLEFAIDDILKPYQIHKVMTGWEHIARE